MWRAGSIVARRRNEPDPLLADPVLGSLGNGRSPAGLHVKSPKSALIVAAIFGLLNFLLGWLLFAVFAVATLGIAWLLAFITRWIVNAILLVITDKLTDHLKIDGFRWALAGAFMMSLVGTIGEWIVRSMF